MAFWNTELGKILSSSRWLETPFESELELICECTIKNAKSSSWYTTTLQGLILNWYFVLLSIAAVNLSTFWKIKSGMHAKFDGCCNIFELIHSSSIWLLGYWIFLDSQLDSALSRFRIKFLGWAAQHGGRSSHKCQVLIKFLLSAINSQ